MRLVIVILIILGIELCSGCEPHERRRGCRIHNKICTCDEFSCGSEYRYATYKECQQALEGKKIDGCFHNPCMNNGTCIQITQFPAYKCRCSGTGYFGSRCNRACPKGGGAGRIDIFPYECIVI